ncbi:MAG TPA: hypothetical protein PLV25_05910, partial [Opitutales bacterium]|nr:hypothetical protein [Opitutales bacterium]
LANGPYLLHTRIQTGHWQDDRNWFQSADDASESYVIGRVLQSRQHGMLSNNCFMGRFQSTTPELILGEAGGDSAYQYLLIEPNSTSPQAIYIPYLAQAGASGLLFSAIDALCGHKASLNVLHGANAALSALVLAAICWLFAKEFGLLPAIFACGAILLTGWIVGLGRNLYWVIWTLYLPFLIVFYNLFKEFSFKHKTKPWIGYSLLFCALVFRFLCGLEYFTTVLVSMTVPLFYYAIQYKLSFVSFCKRFAWLTTLGFASLIAAVAVWILQLYGVFHQFSLVFTFIQYTAGKRTVAFSGHASTALEDLMSRAQNAQMPEGLIYYLARVSKTHQLEAFTRSLEASLAEVLRLYVARGFWVFIAMFLICTLTLILSNRFQKYTGLWTATAISLLAPISWFVLAQAHCYIHTHLNYMLWFIPYVPLLFVLIGQLGQDLCTHRHKNRG